MKDKSEILEILDQIFTDPTTTMFNLVDDKIIGTNDDYIVGNFSVLRIHREMPIVWLQLVSETDIFMKMIVVVMDVENKLLITYDESFYQGIERVAERTMHLSDPIFCYRICDRMTEPWDNMEDLQVRVFETIVKGNH